MRTLVKYNLDFDKAKSYVEEYLSWKHELSKAILKKHDFSNGEFYTLLTEDADVSKIHDFKVGHILPPFPEQVSYVEGVGESRWEEVNSIADEFTDYFYHFLKEGGDLSFIAEDFLQSPSDLHVDLYRKMGVRYRKHLFYRVTPMNLSLDLVGDVFEETETAWHFVGAVYHSVDQTYKNQKISKRQLKQICSNLTYAVFGAYDGEGYVIWEKGHKKREKQGQEELSSRSNSKQHDDVRPHWDYQSKEGKVRLFLD